MSYRSIKRVLGESSLERKCRILFGVCLLFLFGGAFLAADRVAEQLVVKNTRSKAHDQVAMSLVRLHFIELSRSESATEDFSATADLIAANAGMEGMNLQVFSLDGVSSRSSMSISEPGENDQRMLEKIQAEIDRRKKEHYESQEESDEGTLDDGTLDEGALDEFLASQDLGDPGAAITGDEDPANQPFEFGVEGDVGLPWLEEQINVDYRPSRSGQYHFYALFEMTQNCLYCHFDASKSAPELARSGTTSAREAGIVVVKANLPDEQTQGAINWIRAILISVAIVTVFIAMLTSYVIVRYVIVKPLRHLRDVSDEISRGKTELRAELQTGDEFEELAASFNRMLRHLIDTQKELRHVNRDLDKNVDELAQLNMRLYEMNQLKGEFLANMSHELRTPLNSIIGFSEVLEGIDSLNDKQKRYASNIRKSGRLLLDMINDILDLAKIDAGKMEIKPTDFRIDGVIGELVDMVRPLATEKNIDVQVVTEPDAPPMHQDQVKIQQILTNLLSNAIKFTPEGGCITVTAKEISNQRLEMSINDTGVGIAEEDRAIIFEKFRQGTAVLGHDNLTREYSGTGLGLSIVKELCRLLGGEVSVESEVGKGSVFTVTLPWTLRDEPVRNSDLTSRLNELTKPKRVDFDKNQWAPGVNTKPREETPAS